MKKHAPGLPLVLHAQSCFSQLAQVTTHDRNFYEAEPLHCLLFLAELIQTA